MTTMMKRKVKGIRQMRVASWAHAAVKEMTG